MPIKFAYMEPYAGIVGQHGHKSAPGEYMAKTFKEAPGKDISGAVLYTIADKLKLKAFKRQKYQCVNLAWKAFTTYLDDIPAKMLWAHGSTADVYKECAADFPCAPPFREATSKNGDCSDQKDNRQSEWQPYGVKLADRRVSSRNGVLS